MKKYFSILCLLFVSLTISAQTTDTLFVGWYNVENLFDPFDNPNAYNSTGGDDEYTPATNGWNEERYDTKIQHLASVINRMNNGRGPDILGFCEVENQNVIWDMINKYFTNKNYRIVHKESQDARGIDVSLIYRSDKFRLDMMSAWAIDLDDGYITRDVVHAKLMYKDTPLHVLINHWPSKRGGAEKSEPSRIQAAKRTLDALNHIKANDPNAEIILLGDFNEGPDEPALLQTLGAKSVADYLPEKNGEYWNLVYPIWNPEKYGSYNYQQRWEMIDNIIVNRNMLDNKGFSYLRGSAEVFSFPEMKEQSGKYAGAPLRTYAGKKYLGGYSDHFPISVKITYK